MNLCIYVHIHVCVYIYTCTHIYIHKTTHAYFNDLAISNCKSLLLVLGAGVCLLKIVYA